MNWFIDFLDDVQHDLKHDVRRMNMRRRANKFFDFLDDVQHDLKHDVKRMNVRRRAHDMKKQVQNVDMHKERFSTEDFIFGVIAGAFAGFLVALFVAPKSGRETRAYLSDKTREVGAKAKDTIGTATDKAGRLVERSRDRVGSTLKRSQKQGRDMAYDTRERVSDTLDRAADEVDPNRRF